MFTLFPPSWGWRARAHGLDSHTPSRTRRPGALALEELEGRLLLSTYYLSPQGNDNNNGTSTTRAWRSISRVNQQNFHAGDAILFQGGATFSGSLYFDQGDQGTAAAPVRVGSYGTGRATINAGTDNGLYAYDTGGLTITNLNFVGAGPTANGGNGILFFNDLNGDVLLNHVYIDQVDVSGFGDSGINIGAWNGYSGYQDVRVTNAKLHNNQLNGLYTYSPSAAYSIQDVYVGHVQAYNNPGATWSPPSGSGILLLGVYNSTIERSVAHDNGATGYNGAGIWTADSDSVTIQYNESYRNHTGWNADGDGFDLDGGVTNSVLQYNYSHDNDGAGYLLCTYQGDPLYHWNNTVRFNVSQNDGRRGEDGAVTVYGEVYSDEIYNNTLYMSPPSPGAAPSGVSVSAWTGANVHFRNNIIQTTGGLPLVDAWTVSSANDLVFQGNAYYTSGAAFVLYLDGGTYTSLSSWRSVGQEVFNGQDVGYSGNPGLTNPGGGGTIGNADRLNTLTAYRLQNTSPLLNAGLDLWNLVGLDPGTHDYYGNTISATANRNIGAF